MSVIGLLEQAGVECYSRTEWGSPREADGSYDRRAVTHPMPSTPALYHFLHITVTEDTDFPADGKEAAKKVETFGLSTPPMVSYHDLVTNEGRYFAGMPYGVKGTHTINDKDVPGFPHDLNLWGYATALMQNVQDEVTDVQVELVAMIAAAREIEGKTVRGAPIYPHRMFDWKACPGDKAMARLDEIRALKTQFVLNGLPNKEDEVKDADLAAIRQIVREEIDAQFAEHVEVNTATGTRRISYTQLLRELWQKVDKHI
jgi:hypothetical protein